MRLLLDEGTHAKRLVELLRNRGHDLLSVGDLDCRGASDTVVLALACEAGRILLTRNCADFLVLHRQSQMHAGIICVYQDADPAKCLRYVDIARALGNLQDAQVLLQGEFVALNAWLY